MCCVNMDCRVIQWSQGLKAEDSQSCTQHTDYHCDLFKAIIFIILSYFTIRLSDFMTHPIHRMIYWCNSARKLMELGQTLMQSLNNVN